MSSINSKGNYGPIANNTRTGDRGSRPSSSACTASMPGPVGQGVLPSSMTLNDPPLPHNPQKQWQGFSLFPTKASNSQPPPPTVDIPVSKAPTYHDRPMTRSDSISNRSVSTVPTTQYNTYQSGGHLSLAAVLEWKKAHKKSKKNVRVPPVRGVDLLDKLNDRDHVFIVDDGISMREQWPQVKTAFEALSYILKPMASDGIELFFTVAYDAWRRHNTTELVDLLEKKGLAGDTDISYRLGLQLQDYTIKTQPAAQMASKKAKKVRPLNFYVLTDGNWKDKSNPTAVIKDIADHLIKADLKSGQLLIQFISFGQNAAGLQRMNDIANADFGLDLVDTTPSTGDVLKMLCGPLDKTYFQGGGSLSGAASSASTLILPLNSRLPIELA